jgi:hypothetical protein
VTVSADGRSARVRLPAAEILSTYLDERRTELYDHQTGLLTRPDASLVIEAQRAGAGQVLQTACRDGILQKATRDSQRSIEGFLRLVGFETVEVETAPAPTCPDAAPTAPSATPTP